MVMRILRIEYKGESVGYVCQNHGPDNSPWKLIEHIMGPIARYLNIRVAPDLDDVVLIEDDWKCQRCGGLRTIIWENRSRACALCDSLIKRNKERANDLSR
jgi:hypothetical protein